MGVGGKASIVANTFINSPLESGELSLMVKNQLIELLTYELMIHFIMTYLIFMLIFIFTIKVLIDHNISLDKIKHMRPLWLGNIIYNIINYFVIFLNCNLVPLEYENINWMRRDGELHTRSDYRISVCGTVEL